MQLTPPRRSALAILVSAAIVAAAGEARADSCTAPNLIETIPPDKATGVPTNASLFARYQVSAQYQGEPVTFDQAHMGQKVATNAAFPAMSVVFDATEGLLEVTPAAPLTPGDEYVIHWPALRGIDTATLGTSFDQHLTAGTQADVAPPTFGGISSVSWDVSRETDSCTNHIEERYVFHLGLGPAADDGGRDSLTLLVFQTSGPGIDASAPAPVLVQRIPPEGAGVTITSTVQVGHVCFAAIVRDLTMNVSTSGAPVCVDTVEPPFFYGCAVLPGARRGRSGPAALFAAAALAVVVARRGGSSRRRRWERGD